jgi:hypothetical protein
LSTASQKRIGVIGLRISSLEGNPQITLMGNPVRSWALFSGLQRYNFDTELFVDPHSPVSEDIHTRFGSRFVRNTGEFLKRASAGHYDGVIVCGTRIHTTLEQHPWLADLNGCPVFLGQCYHNVETRVPSPLIDNIVGACFVTPRYQYRWATEYPGTRTGIMMTGEVAKPATATVSNGDAVFVGHIHGHAIIKKMTQVAAQDSKRNYHIVSSRIRRPQITPAEYITFAPMADEAERQQAFASILTQCGAEKPDNFHYHFLPPGEEQELMDKVSVGLDFSWNDQWLLDNSKVPNYLSYGLNVVTQLPAPSYRFVHKFNAGKPLAYNADAYAWRDAIQEAAELSVARKNELRREAGAYFSWTNAVFDLAAVMMDYFDQQES